MISLREAQARVQTVVLDLGGRRQSVVGSAAPFGLVRPGCWSASDDRLDAS
jgi:hypothetical protein